MPGMGSTGPADAASEAFMRYLAAEVGLQGVRVLGTTTPGNVEDAVVEAAKAGDEAAFAELVGRHRRELHVHCYRMLGSFEEAEDLVQETLLRAWRRRESFQAVPGSGPGCTRSPPTPAWTRWSWPGRRSG